MKISNIILCLNAGGAENAASIIANYLSKKHKVSFLLFVKRKEWPIFYRLEKSIKINELDLYKKSRNFFLAIFGNIKRIQIIHKNLKKEDPDIIIAHCSREIVLTFLASFFLNKKIIGYIHSDPKKLVKEKSTVWLLATYISFSFIDHCIVFSKEAKKKLPLFARKKAIILPNVSSESDQKKKNYKDKNIIMVGSLIDIKNHSFVIRNFSKIIKKFPDWTLSIIGDGPLKISLEKLINKMELSKNVFLLGNKKNVFNIYNKSSIYVLSSISEGMNLSLIEAIKFGLPILSSDCSLSHQDLIIHKRNGFLFEIKSDKKFIKYLSILIESEKMRLKYGSESLKISKMFKNKIILQKWDNLLEEKFR